MQNPNSPPEPFGVDVEGRFLRTARLSEEWLTSLDDPGRFARDLRARRINADLFTFWQRIPQTEPIYGYDMEWDNVAALSLSTYREWWEKKTNANVRRAVRKSIKAGVETRVVPFDHHLVEGMLEIFNESPVRQGKPMRHYGKTAEQLRREYQGLLHTCDFIGAFSENRLVGFLMLVYADHYAYSAMIISLIEERNKFPNNALVAKAVDICCHKEISRLLYTKWYDQGVTEFKRRNGFEKVEVPRYYIPLTLKGKLALKLNLHRGASNLVPPPLRRVAKSLRSNINHFLHGAKS